jgi:acetylglutamate kinase
LVVKLGGALLDDAAQFGGVFDALAELHHSLAGGLIVLHGGGKAVDRQLDRMGIVTERRDGIRITPPHAVEQVTAVLAGSMNTQLLGQLLARGVPAVGLTLSDGHLAHAQRATHYSFDPGCVGELAHGQGHLLHHLLAGGYMPVLSSIGVDTAGGFLNINADDAAAQIAGIVRARGLLLLTDVPGVRDAQGSILKELNAHQAEQLIAEGVISGGMIAKVRGAVAAAKLGGVPVVIAAWTDPQALRVLGSGGSIGTRVVHTAPRPELSPCTARTLEEFAHHA